MVANGFEGGGNSSRPPAESEGSWMDEFPEIKRIFDLTEEAQELKHRRDRLRGARLRQANMRIEELRQQAQELLAQLPDSPEKKIVADQGKRVFSDFVGEDHDYSGEISDEEEADEEWKRLEKERAALIEDMLQKGYKPVFNERGNVVSATKIGGSYDDDMASAMEETRERLSTEYGHVLHQAPQVKADDATADDAADPNRGLAPETRIARAMRRKALESKRSLRDSKRSVEAKIVQAKDMLRGKMVAIDAEARSTEQGKRLMEIKDRINEKLPPQARLVFIGVVGTGAVLFAPNISAAVAIPLLANRVVPAGLAGITAAAVVGKSNTRRLVAGVGMFAGTLLGGKMLADWWNGTDIRTAAPPSPVETVVEKTPASAGEWDRSLKGDLQSGGQTEIEKSPTEPAPSAPEKPAVPAPTEAPAPEPVARIKGRILIDASVNPNIAIESTLSHHFFDQGGILADATEAEKKQFLNAFARTVNSNPAFGKEFAGVQARNALNRVVQDHLNFDIMRSEGFREKLQGIIVKNNYEYLLQKWGGPNGVRDALSAMAAKYE